MKHVIMATEVDMIEDRECLLPYILPINYRLRKLSCLLFTCMNGRMCIWPTSLSLSLSATLSPLLEEGFEAKAFATATIQNQMVGDTLHKLANGIAALDKELYSQVDKIS